MYHWRLVTISSGFSPFSKNLTWWVIGFGSPTSALCSRSSSTIAVWAWKMVLPARRAYALRPASVVIQSGHSALVRPLRSRIERVGRRSSLHQVTSVVSPNVQIMAMPEPLSGWASPWARTGTSTPKTGEVTVVPKRGR